MNPEQLKEMNKITWWHTMLLDGILTKGRDESAIKLMAIQMPQDLKEKTVIDIGAWDGFFSFEAERRGAEVLAVDTYVWQRDKLWDIKAGKEIPHTGKAGFNFARKILNSKVEDKEIEVMDLSEKIGQFDLVLCLGILYHMEDPFGMCKRMFDITKKDGMLILETHLDSENTEYPVMSFYPNKECNNDPGTWWGPNPECVEEMLKAAGYKEVKRILISNHRGIFHAFK